MLSFQKEFSKSDVVLLVYLLFADKDLWLCILEENIYVVLNVQIKHRGESEQINHLIHAGQKIFRPVQKPMRSTGSVIRCVMLALWLYISDLLRLQLNSALPQDFTDIFQGLAFQALS